ncbi:hypothetical protein K2173_011711 [Erythroxylum novogranatense]|uniref:Transcription factor GTE6 n=1 Tax=Erythroxylum novogranatense TaxID=1862640 RepID=A0AAV8T1X3_9ROSI|nr:hypothetical protein K2173_011711 [Erythroxylum novogranatense]
MSQRRPTTYTRPAIPISILCSRIKSLVFVNSRAKLAFVIMRHQMEPIGGPLPDYRHVRVGDSDVNVKDIEGFKDRLEEIFLNVDKLELKVNEIEQFYSSIGKKQPTGSKGSSVVKEKERHVSNIKKKQHQDPTQRDATAAKRMQELIRQFGTILRQLTQHKWALPFMQPVDVEGLGLDDYYEIIDKPMDFSTIKTQMEAKDGTGYKNVREICADVRLIFKNAMKYNEERSEYHVKAKTLLGKFEEKWLQFLPKVTEEERIREEEEAEAQMDMQLAQEAAHAKMAKCLSSELHELDMHLEDLRDMVVKKCRKISTDEKRKLWAALARLSPEDLTRALDIVAENNPAFQAKVEEVELDMDAQSESTLWRLKFFVKDALKAQDKATGITLCNANTQTNNNNNNKRKREISLDNDNIQTNNNNKRKREICDAIAKTAKKRTKKPTS